MNPTGKNQWIDENPTSNIEKFNEEFFKSFTIMVTSENKFENIKKWDEISKKANIPYYNQLGCGLYAFSYISLGSRYEFKEINKKDKQVSKIWEISSLGLEDCLRKESLTKSKESLFLSALISKYWFNLSDVPSLTKRFKLWSFCWRCLKTSWKWTNLTKNCEFGSSTKRRILKTCGILQKICADLWYWLLSSVFSCRKHYFTRNHQNRWK